MAHSKYSDERIQENQGDDKSGGLHEHGLRLLPVRRYDPGAGGDDGEGGIFSKLTEFSIRDNMFYERGKLGRYSDDLGNSTSEELEQQMPTFHGVPKGMPEQLGRAREAAGERGAILYGNPV